MKKYAVIGFLLGLAVVAAGVFAGAVTITRNDKSVQIDRLTVYGNGYATVDYSIYPTGNLEFVRHESVEVNLSGKAQILADCVAAIKAKEDIP